MRIRLLHTADLHLDRPFLGLGERRTARRFEMQKRVAELVALAREKEAAAILMAGDLFDRPTAESGHWLKAQLAAAAAAGMKFFIIPGNHDELDRCSFYQGDFPPGVHVFRSPDFTACDDLPGVTVYGLAYRKTRRHHSPLAGLPNDNGECWRVGLVHGQLRDSDLIGEDYAPFTAAEIAACGLDYLALGHYHSCRDCSAGSTKAFYSGSPYRLDFSDNAERCALLVELGDDGVAVESIPLPDRPFLLVEGDAGRPEELYERVMQAAKPEAYVRVRLRGRSTEPAAGLVADLKQKFSNCCFGFEVQTSGLDTVEPAAQPGTVAEVFSRLIAERLAAADEEQADLLRLAKDYGLLALSGRELP